MFACISADGGRASHGVGLLHRLAGLEGTYAVALTAPGAYLQQFWDATHGRRGSRRAAKQVSAADRVVPSFRLRSSICDQARFLFRRTCRSRSCLSDRDGRSEAHRTHKLVEQHSPHWVVLVVADAAGYQVDFVGGHGGEPDREVRELAIEPRPARVRGRRVGSLQRVCARDLPVEGRGRRTGWRRWCQSVAGDEIAAGELPDGVAGGRVVGVPASVDDLGLVARVVCVCEVGAVREKAERGSVPELRCASVYARTVSSGCASSSSSRSRWRSVRFLGRLSHMYRVCLSRSRWCFDSSRRTSSTAFERWLLTW